VRALRATAHRIQLLQADQLQTELTVLVSAVAPWLLEVPSVGPLSAAQVLVSWSHAGRLRSEAAFAALAGTNPIPASSGQVTRYRLNRGGDRQLNRALHTILLVRLRIDPTPGPTWPGAQPRARAAATPSGACAASSPASCTGSWNATTNPASKSYEPLDNT
jgi:transposase